MSNLVMLIALAAVVAGCAAAPTGQPTLDRSSVEAVEAPHSTPPVAYKPAPVLLAGIYCEGGDGSGFHECMSDEIAAVRVYGATEFPWVLEALQDALDRWDAAVSYRTEVRVTIHDGAEIDRYGSACGTGPNQVEIYAGNIERSGQLKYEFATRVALHEMGHVHLGCTDHDHVDDRGSIMHPSFPHAHTVDPETASRIESAR